jgi:hypothetical protein
MHCDPANPMQVSVTPKAAAAERWMTVTLHSQPREAALNAKVEFHQNRGSGKVGVMNSSKPRAVRQRNAVTPTYSRLTAYSSGRSALRVNMCGQKAHTYCLSVQCAA